MNKLITCFLILSCTITSIYGEDSELEILKDRIRKLEELFLLQDQQMGRVSTFEAKSMTIGGYFNLTGTNWHLPHSRDQYSFDEVEFGLMINGQINSSLSFFSHIEFEQERQIENIHAPYRTYVDAQEQMEPEDVFMTYQRNNEMSFSFGALITAFGVSNREHFDFLRWQNEKPLALRENDGDFLFFDDHVMGLSLNQTYQIGSGFFESSVYAGSIKVGAGRIATGFRAGYRSEQGDFKIGTSFQTGQKRLQDRYYSYGLDIKARINRFEFRSELFLSDLKSGLYSQGSNPLSFYFEPWYHLVQNRHILYARFDYLHDTIGLNKIDHDRDNSTDTIVDPVELYEATLGYNFLPWPNWRLSLGVTQTSYVGKNSHVSGEKRDYTSIEWGTVLSF